MCEGSSTSATSAWTVTFLPRGRHSHFYRFNFASLKPKTKPALRRQRGFVRKFVQLDLKRAGGSFRRLRRSSQQRMIHQRQQMRLIHAFVEEGGRARIQRIASVLYRIAS